MVAILTSVRLRLGRTAATGRALVILTAKPLRFGSCVRLSAYAVLTGVHWTRLPAKQATATKLNSAAVRSLWSSRRSGAI